MTALIKGDRVKLSPYAIERNIAPKKIGMLGTVVTNKLPASVCYSVLWDGRKTAQALHEHFLEKVKP